MYWEGQSNPISPPNIRTLEAAQRLAVQAEAEAEAIRPILKPGSTPILKYIRFSARHFSRHSLKHRSLLVVLGFKDEPLAKRIYKNSGCMFVCLRGKQFLIY